MHGVLSMRYRSRETNLNRPIRDKSNSVVANRIAHTADLGIRPVHLQQHVLLFQLEAGQLGELNPNFGNEPHQIKV